MSSIQKRVTSLDHSIRISNHIIGSIDLVIHELHKRQLAKDGIPTELIELLMLHTGIIRDAQQEIAGAEEIF